MEDTKDKLREICGTACVCMCVYWVCTWAKQWASKCLCLCVRQTKRHASTSAEGSRILAETALSWVEGRRRRRESRRGGGGGRERTWLWNWCPAMWWWQGGVRPDWLWSLMEVDLESLLPLTDSDCSVNTSRTHSHALSPRPPSAGGSHTCMRVYRCALHMPTHTLGVCTRVTVAGTTPTIKIY